MTPSDLTPRETLLLSILTHAAERGQECPTNSVLAVSLGSSATGAVAALRRLERKGLIAVQRAAQARRVTILATDEATAPIKGGVHWRYRDKVTPARQRDQFAELIAEGLTSTAARRELRISSNTAAQFWREIRDGLGWQAV